MEDAPNLHSRVGVRVGTPLGGNQEPPVLETGFPQVLGVVVGVPEHEARLLGQFLNRGRSHPVVRGVRRGEPGGQRYPHRGHRHRQVQSFHP